MVNRETTIKKLRAKAHREQTSFRTAVATSHLAEWKKESLIAHVKSASVGKTLARAKEADTYVDKRGNLHQSKGVCLDEGLDDYDSPCDFGFHLAPRSRSPMVISLADVKTTVAKPKGVRKEYYWVERVDPVLVLDDDLKSVVSEEDWEDIYAEQQAMLNQFKKPYSTVASGSHG